MTTKRPIRPSNQYTDRRTMCWVHTAVSVPKYLVQCLDAPDTMPSGSMTAYDGAQHPGVVYESVACRPGRVGFGS